MRNRSKHARRAQRVPVDKRDGNEDKIVDAIIACGGRVQRISQGGVPDLAVWVPAVRRWFLFEVKSPGGKLTPAQEEFRDHFGADSRHVIETPDQAVDLMQAIRKQA